MNFERLTVGAYKVNCSLIWGSARQVLVVDPGFDAEHIVEVLRSHDLSVAGYLLTHRHVDHIHALAELHALHAAPVFLHPADRERAFCEPNQISPHYSVPKRPAAEWVDPVSSKVWKISDLSFQCLEAPGHTPGGVYYWFADQNLCFTGDTFLKGVPARMNRYTHDADALQASLCLLATLPPSTLIVPGHGDPVRLEQELLTNAELKRAVEERASRTGFARPGES